MHLWSHLYKHMALLIYFIYIILYTIAHIWRIRLCNTWYEHACTHICTHIRLYMSIHICTHILLDIRVIDDI